MTERGWLNGWPRMNRHTVAIGTGVFCVGCGHFFGTMTVAFEEGWKASGLEPSWPFDADACPVHDDDVPAGKHGQLSSSHRNGSQRRWVLRMDDDVDLSYGSRVIVIREDRMPL